jgi:hypothetical protein
MPRERPATLAQQGGLNIKLQAKLTISPTSNCSIRLDFGAMAIGTPPPPPPPGEHSSLCSIFSKAHALDASTISQLLCESFSSSLCSTLYCLMSEFEIKSTIHLGRAETLSRSNFVGRARIWGVSGSSNAVQDGFDQSETNDFLLGSSSPT